MSIMRLVHCTSCCSFCIPGPFYFITGPLHAPSLHTDPGAAHIRAGTSTHLIRTLSSNLLATIIRSPHSTHALAANPPHSTHFIEESIAGNSRLEFSNG